MVSALLIAALADNLTDSLSIHMYQESECLEQREVFVGTVTNFATRFIVCLSFVLIVALFQGHAARAVALVPVVAAVSAQGVDREWALVGAAESEAERIAWAEA